MKICPTCRQTYSDDNLNFCLNDGVFLSPAGSNEPRTIVMEQSRVTNQTNWNQQTAQPPAWPQQTGVQTPNSGFPMRIQSPSQSLPTVSLVLGVFSILTVCCYGGLPLGLGAIITGLIAINQEKNDPANYGGRGLAIGGIVTGSVALLVGLLFLFLAVFS